MASLLSTFTNAVKKAYNKVGEKWADIIESAVSWAKKATDTFNTASEKAWSKAFDIVQWAKEWIWNQAEMIAWSLTDPYKWKSISDITNEALGRLGESGKIVWEKAGGFIDKWLWINSDFKWVLGRWLGTITSAPKNITEWLRSWIESSAEAIWSAQWWDYQKAVSKTLKTFIDPALSVISSTPVPLAVQTVLQSSWIGDYANKWVDIFKTTMSDGLKNLWVDADVSEELWNTLVDWLQTYLAFKWWAQSAKMWDAAKLQTINDVTRQAKILENVRTKAAARPGATPETIAIAVENARPTVSQAKAAKLTAWDVASHNLKMLGYDVAANSAIPVLWIALQSVKDGEAKNIYDALGNIASNASVTLATALPWFRGIKALKTKPSEAQMKLDTEIATPKEWITKEQATALKESINTGQQKQAEAKSASDKVIAETNTVPTLQETVAQAKTKPVEVITARDRKKYIVDNSEEILTTWKVFGKKINKEERKLIQDISDKKKNTPELFDEYNKLKIEYGDNPPQAIQDRLDLIENRIGIANAEPILLPAKTIWTRIAEFEKTKQWFLDEKAARDQAKADAEYAKRREEEARKIVEAQARQAREEQAGMNLQRNLDIANARKQQAANKARWQQLAEQVKTEILDKADQRARMADENDVRLTKEKARLQDFEQAQDAQPMDFLTEFSATNPTKSQVEAATQVRQMLDTGESPANLMRSTALSKKQKELIIKSYQQDLTESRTPTIQETIIQAKAKQPGDLDFLGGTQYMSNADYNKALDTVKASEPSASDYRLKTQYGAIAYKNISDRAALNNIERVFPDWRVVDEGNYIDTSIKNLTAQSRQVKQDFVWLTKDNLAPVITFKKKLVPADLIGKESPEWIVITPENVGEFIKSYNNIDKATFVPEWFDGKEFENATKASYIYSLIKNDEALLKKYFTPDQLTVLKNFDDAAVKQAQWAMSAKAIEDKIFTKWMMNPDYMHLVMTKENYDRIPKYLREPITIDIGNGQVRTFNNPIEAESFVRLALSRGETITPDMANLSSLTKKQWWADLDPYRIHGWIASLASYIKKMAETEGDVFLANELKNLAKNKNAGKYMSDIRNNFFGNSLEARILGLNEYGTWEKIQDIIWSVWAITKIAWSIATFVQGWVSSTLKNIADSVKSAWVNAVKWRFGAAMRDIAWAITSTPGTLLGIARKNMGGSLSKLTGNYSENRRIQETLANEWFISGYEVADNIKSWPLREFVWVSSGARQENAAKTDLALRSMRRTLLDNGYKVSDPKSIIDAWTTFKKEKPLDYQYARNNIYNETLFLGDMSRLSRLWFLGAQRTLWPIKTFSTGLVAQSLDDVRTIVSEAKKAVKKEWGDWNRVGNATTRSIANIAAPFLIYQGIMSMLPDDMDESMKDKIAKVWQERAWPSSWQSISQWVQWLFDSVWYETAAQILWTTVWLIDVGMKWKEQEQSWETIGKTMAGKVIDDARRILVWLNTINRASRVIDPNDSLQNKIAEIIGTTNLEWATQYGTATGNQPDSRLEAVLDLLGFGIDSPITNVMRNPDVAVNKEINTGIKDYILPMMAFKDSEILRNWEDSTLGRMWLSVLGKFVQLDRSIPTSWSTWEVALQKQRTYDALAAINWPKKNFDEILDDMNIDSALTPVIKQIIIDRLTNIANQNNNVEERYALKFDPRKITSDTMQWILQELHEKNPKWFNDIVSGLAEIGKDSEKWFDYSLLQKVKWKTEFVDPAAQAYIESIKTKFTDSSATDDQVVSDFYNERALTTSAINQAFQALNAINPKTATKQEMQDAVAKVEAYLSFLDKNANYTGNHIDAAALKSFESAKKFIEWFDLKKLGTLSIPVTMEYITKALSLRWEDVPQKWVPSIQETVTQAKGTWKWTWKWYTANITEIPWVPTKPQKQEKFDFQDGSVKPIKTEAVQVKSLQEILQDPQLRQSIRDVNSLKKNSDLALFSNKRK